MALATNNSVDELAFAGFSEIADGKLNFDGTDSVLSLDKLREEFENRNPLGMVKDHQFYYKYIGKLTDCPGGMIDACNDQTVAAYQRAPEDRPDYDHLKKGLDDTPIAREGDVSHAYITQIKIDEKYNNSPIPFAVEIHEIKGEQYHHALESNPSWRSLAIINPIDSQVYNPPKILHQLAPSLNIAEVVAYDNLDFEDIGAHLTVFRAAPDWTLVMGGLKNPILPLIANQENMTQFRRYGFKDQVEVNAFGGIGETLALPTWVANTAINGLKRKSAIARQASPRVNMTKLVCQFHPISNKPGITMENIHEHEYFDGKSKEEVDRILSQPYTISVNLYMDYALKDDVMEAKIKERLEKQQQAVLQ